MKRRILFGQKLREVRKFKGYSQEQLAEIAGLHRTYIGDVERGKRNIALDNIWRLADALNVNPSTFFTALAEDMENPESINQSVPLYIEIENLDEKTGETK